MDPITAATLAALAGGLGSEAGRQVWQSLTAIVRRPFGRGAGEGGAAQVSSGEVEVAALQGDPTDPVRAQALATALGVRAALDGEFRVLLEEWRRQAEPVAGGDVYNSITGGTQTGTVVQGRDFTSLTFQAPRDPDAPGRE
ncbi:hypothetical protein [Streptomyces sp. NPDC047315]|uniref:hypothetical protein n=1 Tax=Streptomyces sp. NPDC047315 TaxID=3155142 RepID=UPI003403E285